MRLGGFTRPFDWVLQCFMTSFTEFSTCFTDILLSLVPVLLNIDLIDPHIDLKIDLPHASYPCPSDARMCLVS